MYTVTFENYSEIAKTTMAELGSLQLNLAHMALGISSELTEMMEGAIKEDMVNVREEHGDLNWFLAVSCELLGLQYSSLLIIGQNHWKDSEADPMHGMMSIGNIAGMVKDFIAYGKKIDKLLYAEEVKLLVMFLYEIADQSDFQYGHSLQKNIEKLKGKGHLKGRYADEFTLNEALERSLETERENLED